MLTTDESADLLLVIDSHLESRARTAETLRGAGFRVQEAATGGEALALVGERPALMLLEVDLPDISGFEVCRRIKADPATAATPVLHLSRSRMSWEDQAWGLDGGADGYLTQPVDEPVLIASVHSLLRHRRAGGRSQDVAAEQQRFLRDILASVTEGRLHLCRALADLPPPLEGFSSLLPVSAEGVIGLRREVDAVAAAQGMALERRHDLLTAVSEAATNAVKHGGGGVARVRAGGGRVQVWIEDRGGGITLEKLPLAAIEHGHAANSLRHGFWMMLRTVDRLWLLTWESGTTVVLEQFLNGGLPPVS